MATHPCEGKNTSYIHHALLSVHGSMEQNSDNCTEK